MKEPKARAFNEAYIGLRPDIVALIPHQEKPVILDVGCAMGATGAWLKREMGATVVGVEGDEVMAEEARHVLDEVHVIDLDTVRLSLAVGGRRFDVIIFGDVLEHLIDPWGVLAGAVEMLNPGGRIVTSIPNVCHYSTLISLMFCRDWPYRDRGIHDRTHLRFFTQKNLLRMFEGAGLVPLLEKRNMRMLERGSRLDRFASAFAHSPLQAYFTFQYVHLLARAGDE